jgi:integrase
MPSVNTKIMLTDFQLKKLQRKHPPVPADERTGKRIVIWDAGQPHMALRVTETGHMSFVVVRRRPGDRHPLFHVLGTYPVLSLANARKLAAAALTDIMAGRHPADIVRQQKVERDRRAAATCAVAIDAFLEDQRGRKLRSGERMAGDLQRDFLGHVRDPRNPGVWIAGKSSVWANRPVAELTRADVIARLDQIKRARGKHAARHALSAVRCFLNWCADGERYGIVVSPCTRVRDKTLGITGRDLKRTRVLDDAEIRDVWLAAQEISYPHGAIAQLLLLTGQRLNDIARAQWSEITDGVVTVPAERYKTATAQLVPLPPQAVTILDGLPRFIGGDYVFSVKGGRRPVSGLTEAKTALDRAIARRREEEGRAPMPAWVIHDLRRTVRTRLVGDCGVDAFTAERVLGHALPGLHGVYDQGTHLNAKRIALVAWERRLLEIVEPSEPSAGDVVAAKVVGRRRKSSGA